MLSKAAIARIHAKLAKRRVLQPIAVGAALALVMLVCFENCSKGFQTLPGIVSSQSLESTDGTPTGPSPSPTPGPAAQASVQDDASATAPPPNPDGSFAYGWVGSVWGQCSSLCNGGTRTREVVCERSDSTVEADSSCSGVKPPTSQDCGTQSCASAMWVEEGFSPCSATCGGGTQSQTLLCQSSNGTILTNSSCSTSPPATQQACNTQACPGGAIAGTWTSVPPNSAGLASNAEMYYCQQMVAGQLALLGPLDLATAPNTFGGTLFDPVAGTWSTIPAISFTSAYAQLPLTCLAVGNSLMLWTGSGAGVPDPPFGVVYTLSKGWTTMPLAGDPTTPPAKPPGEGAPSTLLVKFLTAGNFLAAGNSVYDPVANTWTAAAPSAYWPAAWTGSKIIFWGPTPLLYDPVAKTSSPASNTGRRPYASGSIVQWTGTQLIDWGGTDTATRQRVNTGSIYTPATNSWSSMSTAGAPTSVVFGQGTYGYQSVLDGTGNKLFIQPESVPKQELSPTNNYFYDASTDKWTTTSSFAFPTGLNSVRRFWSGSKLIIWTGTASVLGAVFDPASNTWTQIPSPVLANPFQEILAFAANRIFLMGPTPISYDPNTNLWSSVQPKNAPAARTDAVVMPIANGLIMVGGESVAPVCSFAAPDSANSGGQIAAASAARLSGGGGGGGGGGAVCPTSGPLADGAILTF